MKFYSKIVNKPHSITEEVKDKTRVIKRTRLCIFIDGVLETDDPKIIAKLETRKDLFRSDKPWNQRPDWKTTEEGKKLLEEGGRLGIDCRHIREWYLKELIQKKLHPEKKTVEKTVEKVVDNEIPKPKAKIDYKAMIKLAKEAGIRGHGVKKEILRKKLKESGVNA